jgi:hypothetical protein
MMIDEWLEAALHGDGPAAQPAKQKVQREQALSAWPSAGQMEFRLRRDTEVLTDRNWSRSENRVGATGAKKKMRKKLDTTQSGSVGSDMGANMTQGP